MIPIFSNHPALLFYFIILIFTVFISLYCCLILLLSIIISCKLFSISQVRNKLDRCFYAIKRIELNPMNKLLYKKITREVKLLSRLNHENVVRYFNSWIETCNCAENSSASEPSTNSEKVNTI